ncbi:ABC transporter permease [Agrilactobacillus composti DSM 18527 = JCM 14202]|uniref:Putative hemin transport system permease protein HrtB n=1 Tax=Agrilactobacillus composti DSM 18527 = JCM 14202 TaxID=1423734 RepID=X0PNB2_9LACO|nr:ABC transporter permease [Agrilactobacillus composti]KRM30523.1 ABC transporter permease [Agrilactobacillus composti DSM 18527 = JCM 14202]GAF38411.1 ABC transporter permease protein [Agrilactobacillus composti DSM 18527 = JCM 14202]
MFLATKEIWHNKMRYGLIIVTIFLTAYLIFFLTGLAVGLGRNNRTAIDQWPAQQIVLSNYANQSLVASTITPQQVQAAGLTQKGTPMGQTSVVVKAQGKSAKIDGTLFGIRWNSFIAPKLTAGRLPRQTNEVVVDDGLLAAEISRGDKITLNGSKTLYKIVGVTHDNRFYTVPVIFTNLSTFRQQRYGSDNVNNISAIVLRHKTTLKGDDLVQVSKAALINHIPGYTAQVATFGLMIGAMILIIFLTIGIFMYILTIQKISLYGIMRAQGIGNRTIVGALFSQILLVSLLGVVLAVLALGLTHAVMPAKVPFYSNWWLTLILGALNVLIALLGGAISLPKILKVDPLAAIGGD